MSRNAAVKRIMSEARELNDAGPSPDFDAQPLDDNLFEWHVNVYLADDAPLWEGRASDVSIGESSARDSLGPAGDAAQSAVERAAARGDRAAGGARRYPWWV